MGDNLVCKVQGLDEFFRKTNTLRRTLDGPELGALCRAAGKPIADQAKRNARPGPSGRVIRGVNVFVGKKAMQFGAAAVVKVAWKYSGAVFEEWGTKERVFDVMRIPLAKIGGITEGKASTVRAYGAGGSFTRLSGQGFGFLFVRSVRPMSGTHFFERATVQRLPDAQRILDEGTQKLVLKALV